MTQQELAQMYLRRRIRLTPQYTPLSFLESTGTQWIDTGYSPYSSNLDIAVDLELVPNDAQYVVPWGVSQYVSGYWLRIGMHRWDAAGYYRARWKTASYGLSTPAGGWLARHVVRINRMVLSIDDIIVGTYSTWSQQFANTIILCGGLNESTGVINGDKVKLYGCVINNVVTPVLNLLPMLDPDGVPCMFDSITQTPYYNAGTGDFLYG